MSNRSLLAFRIVSGCIALAGLMLPELAFGLLGTTRGWPAAFAHWAWAAPLEALAISVVAAVALGATFDTLGDRARRLMLAPPPWAFGLCAAGFVGCMAAALAWYCFAARPYIGDELSQSFQAHLLIHGHLFALSEPLQEFFDTNQTLTVGGRWFSEFPIGWPTLLAVAGAVHAAWLVNPLLGAWTAYNLYRFFSRITSESTARIATLLFVLSPFVLIMTASEMSHTAALAFIAFALAALPVWVTTTDPAALRRAAVQIGVGVGVAATLRPYDAAIAAIPMGVLQLVTILSHRDQQRSRLRALAWQVAGAAAPLAWLLLANAQTTGNAFLFGYDVLNGAAHRPGFHVDPYGRPFTPVLGILQVAYYLLHLNVALFEWPVPALVLIVVTLASVTYATRWDALLLGLIVTVLIGYSAYWHQGDLFGPRFLFIAVPAFIWFAAKWPAVARLANPTVRRSALALIVVSLCWAWNPFQSTHQFAGVWARVDSTRRSDVYRPIDVGREIDGAHLQSALVFVREPFRERLSARLRALGEPAMMAEEIAGNVDACALLAALDADDSLPTGTHQERLAHVVERSQQAGPAAPIAGLSGAFSLALVSGSPPSTECAHQLELDRHGTAPLDLFLPFDSFDDHGRLGRGVVFARDLGSRDELLRGRFGDRPWYRYEPPEPGDTGRVFVPYSGPQ